MWREYGFAPQTKTQEHNSYVVLLDGAGLQRVGFPVQFLTPEALAHDIRAAAGRHARRLTAPQPGDSAPVVILTCAVGIRPDPGAWR